MRPEYIILLKNRGKRCNCEFIGQTTNPMKVSFFVLFFLFVWVLVFVNVFIIRTEARDVIVK